MNKFKKFLISLGTSFLITLIMLLIFSAILTYTNVSDSLMTTFVFATTIVSVLIGAIMLARNMKEKGMLYGTLFGFIYMVIIYAVNLGFLRSAMDKS
ncbi:MAG: TIGR04086 family membrane protein [Clostridia bacterium]